MIDLLTEPVQQDAEHCGSLWLCTFCNSISISQLHVLTSRGEDSGHQGAHRHGRLPSIAGTDPFLFHWSSVLWKDMESERQETGKVWKGTKRHGEQKWCAWWSNKVMVVMCIILRVTVWLWSWGLGVTLVARISWAAARVDPTITKSALWPCSSWRWTAQCSRSGAESATSPVWSVFFRCEPDRNITIWSCIIHFNSVSFDSDQYFHTSASDSHSSVYFYVLEIDYLLGLYHGFHVSSWCFTIVKPSSKFSWTVTRSTPSRSDQKGLLQFAVSFLLKPTKKIQESHRKPYQSKSKPSLLDRFVSIKVSPCFSKLRSCDLLRWKPMPRCWLTLWWAKVTSWLRMVHSPGARCAR